MDVTLNDIMLAVRLLDRLIAAWEQDEREALMRTIGTEPGDIVRFAYHFADHQLQDAMALHDRLLALIPEEML